MRCSCSLVVWSIIHIYHLSFAILCEKKGDIHRQFSSERYCAIGHARITKKADFWWDSLRRLPHPWRRLWPSRWSCRCVSRKTHTVDHCHPWILDRLPAEWDTSRLADAKADAVGRPFQTYSVWWFLGVAGAPSTKDLMLPSASYIRICADAYHGWDAEDHSQCQANRGLLTRGLRDWCRAKVHQVAKEERRPPPPTTTSTTTNYTDVVVTTTPN